MGRTFASENWGGGGGGGGGYCRNATCTSRYKLV